MFDDADLDAAVAGALYGVYYNAGQCCEARSRILLQSGIYDRFVERFAEKAQRLRVGDPEDPQTQIGAITTSEQFEKIRSYCEIGEAEGAQSSFGGGAPDLGQSFASGMFWSPTAYEANNDHRIAA